MWTMLLLSFLKLKNKAFHWSGLYKLVNLIQEWAFYDIGNLTFEIFELFEVKIKIPTRTSPIVTMTLTTKLFSLPYHRLDFEPGWGCTRFGLDWVDHDDQEGQGDLRIRSLSMKDLFLMVSAKKTWKLAVKGWPEGQTNRKQRSKQASWSFSWWASWGSMQTFFSKVGFVSPKTNLKDQN
jgi:hypothetical protein